MYVPPKFRVEDDEAWRVVTDAGAGSLVIATAEGLQSVFVPVVVSDDRRVLRTHVAKANPWWRAIQEGTEVLALFLTASAYVSPSNYPSRVERPGVVPTWNYVAAEVRGRAVVREDVAWLDTQVRDLTDHFEAHREPRWRVNDSPREYVEAQLQAIVGVEIAVTSIQGKAKLSQNRPVIDHDEVRAKLAEGTLRDQLVAERMKDRN